MKTVVRSTRGKYLEMRVAREQVESEVRSIEKVKTSKDNSK